MRIGDFLEDVKDKVVDFLEDAKDKVVDFFGMLWDKFTSMSRSRQILIVVSVGLVIVITGNAILSSMKVHANNLMDDVEAGYVKCIDNLDDMNADVTDFALRLMQSSEEKGRNTLISPLSVMCALAMTANGAKGETLAQMEAVLGMTTEELNNYIYTYMFELSFNDEGKLNIANSIWFKEDRKLKVNREFLQTNADYYGADVYEAPFNKRTLKDINIWVKDKTDGMIPEMLDSIPNNTVMYLINALSFEAKWEDIYRSKDVSSGTFTKEDGTKQKVEFMKSDEDCYLEDDKATGFIKYYEDDAYAFVALLPNEGVSVSDYLASLDGAKLNAMLSNPEHCSVKASLPKFETEYEVELSQVLKKMGMPLAFDAANADLTGIATSSNGKIYIDEVLHKTFIKVDEKGTRAGAATSVNIVLKGGLSYEKIVYLDRPFVYMLIDCENNIPFFIGTMMDVK